MRIITYAYDPETGCVYSRFIVDGNTKGFAIPVLDFVGMTPENNFAPSYTLERFYSLCLAEWNRVIWTKKIPVSIKNLHRIFWGMKPLAIPEV